MTAGNIERRDEFSRLTETTQGDARTLAAIVLKRDRRRIRNLAVLTVGLWVLAGLFIPSIVLPAMAQVKNMARSLTPPSAGGTAVEPITAPALAETIANASVRAMVVMAAVTAVVLFTEILAAICTVALAITIRRVTLRQVGASLAEISDQLRQLQQR